MEQTINLEILKQYIDRTKQILSLSSPEIKGVKSADDYRDVLLDAFTKIGQLASKNNELLENELYRYLHDEEAIEQMDLNSMLEFNNLLINATTLEILDLPIIQLQLEAILTKAEKTKDTYTTIIALDSVLIYSYLMMNITLRLYPQYDYYLRYRNQGTKAANRLLAYLEPELFESLSDECKEIILIDARYVRSIMENPELDNHDKVNRENLDTLKRALDLADDSFYRNQLPNYNWDNHVFRTLQYLSDITNSHNEHKFNKENLKEIVGYTNQLIDFIKQHPSYNNDCSPYEQKFYLIRNSYLAGEMSFSKYKEELINLLDEKDVNDLSSTGVLVNGVVPFEYILSQKGEDLTDDEKDRIKRLYNEMIHYAFYLPKTGRITFMMSFFSDILNNYIEIDDHTFGKMCLDLMAVIHPPTYVHTLSVANIAKYLTQQLIARRPELFIGCLNTKTLAQVKLKEKEIIDYIYQGALLHDIGKLLIIETIITYGRKLLDVEFELIQTHPKVGAGLLEKYESTKPYSKFALGHHKWYNNQKGYPLDYDLDADPDKILIYILSVADCLDAATDEVGRSYKKGLTLDDFIEQLNQESSTRYAPYIVDLVNEKEIYEGLTELIQKGRNENYRKVYNILKEI